MSKDKTESPRVAVIGAGYWGKNLVRNFYELGHLAIVCEQYEPTRRAIAEKYPNLETTNSVEQVLADISIDGVVIASPAETHGTLVRSALAAGKDVFVEKPLCLSVEEGENLVQIAERGKRVLMVGHLLWYHPAVLKLRELVVSGELGRLEYIYSNRLNMGKIRSEENILWSFAPHDVSVILGLVGEMPEHVASHGGNFLHDKISDVTVSTFSFPSGVRGHIFVSWLHPFKEQKLVVVGDRQMAVFDDVASDNKLMLYPHKVDWQGGVPVASKADAIPVEIEQVEPLRMECLHFLECLKTRSAPRTDGREGLRVLKVLDRSQKSLDELPNNSTVAVANSAAGVHESAFIDDDVTIGEGTHIWHVSHVLKGSSIGRDCRIGQNVVIGPDVEIGNGVKIQNNVSVYKGVTLEDYVFCGPSMVFTNVNNPRSEVLRMDELRETLVRQGASLGANCTIVCGVTVGQYAFVGAGAVVTKDIPDHALVIGNPARIVGWMCRCGEKLTFADQVAQCQCGLAYDKQHDEIVEASV